MPLNRNPKTTALGIVLIAAALVSVFIGKADWSQAVIAITAGAGFLLSKDHDK